MNWRNEERRAVYQGFLCDTLFVSGDWPKPSRRERNPLPCHDSLSEPENRPLVPASASQPRDFNILDVAGVDMAGAGCPDTLTGRRAMRDSFIHGLPVTKGAASGRKLNIA